MIGWSANKCIKILVLFKCMSLCKLEIFPDEVSGVYLVKLVAFTVIFAIVAACFSAGFTEVLNAVKPVPDPSLRILTATGNFVGAAILGMAIFLYLSLRPWRNGLWICKGGGSRKEEQDSRERVRYWSPAGIPCFIRRIKSLLSVISGSWCSIWRAGRFRRRDCRQLDQILP